MRPLLFAAGLFVGSCVSLSAVAQVVPGPAPGDRDLIRDRQEQLLQEQRKRLEGLQQLPGKGPQLAPTPPSVDTRCFPIRQIHLQGASLIGEADQRALLAPFEGQCLGAAQLNDVLKVVTRFYLSRGYVTSRAYLPQQDLGSGELQVLVVEGKLEGLDTTEGGPSAREIGMAFPGATGERLNLRQLEQMVDQLNRLPSRQARIELVPGQDVGGSRVQVKGNPQKPWRVGLTRDNHGEESTGEQQWGASFEWDSPLGLADQLSLYGGVDAVSDEYRHSDSQGLAYSLPWGWWTFSYSYNQSYYRTQGDAGGFPFEMDGDSKSQFLRGERILHRDDVSKTAANLTLSHLRTRNYLENSLIDVSSQRLTELALGFNHGRRIGSAFVNLDLGWQHGIGGLDASDDNDPHGGEPVGRYNKYTLTASYLQPFQLWNESFSVDSLLYVQQSEDVLYSPQRISLGGLASIRGFKDQTLTGDSGGYWRSQVRWSRPVAWMPLRPFVQEYGLGLAYDLGIIEGDRYNGDNHGRLSGNAFELYARGQHLSASVTFARSLERPDALAHREHPIYFSVGAFF